MNITVSITPIPVVKPRKGDWQAYEWLRDNHFIQEMDVVDFYEKVVAGHSFAPALAGKRKDEDFVSAQHIAIDLDGGDYTIEKAMAEPLFTQYGLFAYTTASHTPEHPRVRLVYVCEHPILEAERYVLLLRAFGAMYPTADKSKNYPSASFIGGNEKSDHVFIGNTLPHSLVVGMISLEKARREEMIAKAHERAMAHRARFGEEDYGQMRIALSYVPGDGLPYDTWRSIVMAVHSAFPDQRGLDAVLAWSPRGAHETEQLWMKHLSGEKPVTVSIATLYHHAKQHGWRR